MTDDVRKVNPEMSGRKPPDTAKVRGPLSVAARSAIQEDGAFIGELSREHAENFQRQAAKLQRLKGLESHCRPAWPSPFGDTQIARRPGSDRAILLCDFAPLRLGVEFRPNGYG